MRVRASLAFRSTHILFNRPLDDILFRSQTTSDHALLSLTLYLRAEQFFFYNNEIRT